MEIRQTIEFHILTQLKCVLRCSVSTPAISTLRIQSNCAVSMATHAETITVGSKFETKYCMMVTVIGGVYHV
jgi:hypothetical protein